MATPFTESESDLAMDVGKRKRKRRRAGLGRGLARILTDSQADTGQLPIGESGLLQLVGGETLSRSTMVRRFVVETALATMADGFGLDGVVLAAQTRPTGDMAAIRYDGPTFLAAKLPAGWSQDSPVLFEMYGNLWRALRAGVDPADSPTLGSRPVGPARSSEHWPISIGDHWVWLCRMDDGDQPVAALAIRESPFTPAETGALAAVLGSVVSACSDNETESAARLAIGQKTVVSLKSEGSDVLAEVSADWDLATPSAGSSRSDRRTGLGRATDPVTAVARAAAKACRPRCEVTFAGTSELDDADVSIVMIRDAEQGLRLGFAVRDKGDLTGVAEAVFTAAIGSPAV